MSEIILYDIPCKNKTCWSLNPWKPRLVLNYKGLDYETEWLEYPDIAPTLKSLGLDPNPPGAMPYTCPAARMPDGTLLMDSKKIIPAIETLCPTSSLYLDDEALPQMVQLAGRLQEDLRAVWMSKIPENVLSKSLLNTSIARERKRGPFVRGKEVSYADFVLVSTLYFFKNADETVYARIIDIGPELKTAYDASAKWLERNDK